MFSINNIIIARVRRRGIKESIDSWASVENWSVVRHKLGASDILVIR